MFKNYSIALEMLAVGAKNAIGKDVEAWVLALREYKKTGKGNLNEINKAFEAQVRKRTGIRINLNIISDDLNVNAGVWTEIGAFGHLGSRYYNNPGLKVLFSSEHGLKMVTEIDLKEVKVTGGMADAIVFNMFYSTGVVYDILGFTVDEVVAFFLHELGHAFDMFMHLGEYVWLNYFLTEGIEVLQGKKPNKYKVEVLDDAWLTKNIPDELKDDFTNNRTEDTIRRAIMTTYKLAPRHHLTENGLASKLRDEQMADNFATRLGYGRALVTALDRMNKYYSNSTERLYSSWWAQGLKLMLMTVYAPLTALMIAMYNPLDDRDWNTRYDTPNERMLKVRRDLIQQLKVVKRFADGQTLIDDIEVIDNVLKDYNKDRDVFDMAVTFFRPALRKQQQNLKAEQDLELLMNNDLFLSAFKLNNL